MTILYSEGLTNLFYKETVNLVSCTEEGIKDKLFHGIICVGTVTSMCVKTNYHCHMNTTLNNIHLIKILESRTETDTPEHLR